MPRHPDSHPLVKTGSVKKNNHSIEWLHKYVVGLSGLVRSGGIGRQGERKNDLI